MTNAAIYTRISNDPTGQRAGVERQEQDCRHLAASQSWTVTDVYADNDISAYSGKRRPQYQRLLADIAAGRIDVVVAWHPDRLYRQLGDLGDLIKAVKAGGATIRTVQAGVVDLTTASGVMTAEILASVSKHEVAHSVERVRRAKAQQAADGQYRGGPRPFGYEADGVTIRKPEAQALKEGCSMLLAGASLRAIAADWARRDIRTPAHRGSDPEGTGVGSTWQARAVGPVLMRARNAGLIENRGRIVGPAVWPAIVPEETWRAVVALLTQPGRRVTPGNERRWLLSGIGTCGICGETVRSADRLRGISHYRCRTGKHVRIQAELLDAHISSVVVGRLSRPDAAQLIRGLDDETRIDVDALHERQIVIQRRLDDLAQAYSAGEIELRQLTMGTADLRKQLDAVNGSLATSARGNVLAAMSGNPQAAWDGLDLSRRRAIVHALMDVAINKGKRGRPAGMAPGAPTVLDLDRIVITWK